MQNLIFPTYSFRTKKESAGVFIFDEFRNRWVALTPEEWVRQHLAVYLRDHLRYPGGRMALEISLTVNQRSKRADLVVYGPTGKPWMVVECKSPEINITNTVFFQAATYNSDLKAPFLVVTNGLTLYCAAIDTEKGQWSMLDVLPEYA